MDQGDEGDGQTANGAYAIRVASGIGAFTCAEWDGGRYYPKLQCAVPFTPVTGPRLLVNKGEDSRAVKAGLAAGLKTVTDKLGVSSAHVTFAQQNDVGALEAAGFLH
ncbi:MAG: hypothetical protein E5W00_20685, partial [Mesorhizobium sp.]